MLTRPVLVYDGQCGFCRRWIDRMRRWGLEGIDLVPADQRNAWPGLPEISDQRAAHEMVLALPDGRVVGGGEALPELWRRIPRLRLVAWLLALPGISPVRNRVYRWVAAHRGRDTCEIPAR